MASRRERVVLELDDKFSDKMARAAAVTKLMKNELNSLDGTSTKTEKSVKKTATEVDGLGKSSRKSGPEIDRLSGRLRLLAETGILVGPGIVGAGAVAVPALVGLTGALGAAVLGAGVAVVAFQGVGDAVKALNKAELEPTAENLQAAREELESLSPAAASFVTQIHDLIPALKEVRDSAAEGLFPGLSEGIDSLERRLPIIERISGDIGEALGGLAADGGASLSSGRWGPFLRFVEDEAPEAITSLGHIVGDLSHGVAELFIAFDSGFGDDVIGSLERGANAFDGWATGLSKTEGFEEFVDYVRETGPEVVDALQSMGQATVTILTALGSLSGVSLEGITAFADAVDLIAGSDLGGPLIAAAAAFTIYNRAASVATSVTTKFAGGLSGLGMGGAVGASVLALDLLGAAANNIEKRFDSAAPGVEALTSSLLDLGSTQSTVALAQQVGDLGAAVDDLNADGVKGLGVSLAETANEGGILGNVLKGLSSTPVAAGIVDPNTARDLREAQSSIEAVDQALAGLVTSASPERARQAFDDLAQAQGLTKEQSKQLLSLLPTYKDALAGVANDTKIAAEATDNAARAAERFSTALAGLNGWLDKRAAIRGYRDDVAELAKGLKDGFGRKDVEQLDQTAASIAKVATAIKDPGVRADFLAGAKKSLEDLAAKSGPAAAAEIGKVIRQLDGVVAAANQEADLDVNDTAARTKIDGARTALGLLTGTWTSKVNADTSSAMAELNRLQVFRLVPKTLYINTVNRRSGAGGQGPAASVTNARGGYWPSMRAYAQGDFANGHQPEMAGPGPMRIWRERETAGHAYIPHTQQETHP